MKNLINLGVQELSIKEQKEINGGVFWGKVYSNIRPDGNGGWISDVTVYRFGIAVNHYTTSVTLGNC